MITVTRHGSIAAAVRSIRDVPERIVPYAASTALTRVAQAGQRAVIEEMPRAFDRPVAYTLNSTRVVPSTIDTLTARVAVKNAASGNGTLPENYLYPSVFGGERREKRFERAMRYAGLLAAGERAVPGAAAPLDAAGNFARGEIQRILTATRSAIDQTQWKTDSRRSRRNARNAPYFAGRPGRTRLRGIWRRVGTGKDRRVEPVLIFVRTPPQYRPRLDFEGIVRRVAEANFEREFYAAAEAIRRRRAGS